LIDRIANIDRQVIEDCTFRYSPQTLDTHIAYNKRSLRKDQAGSEQAGAHDGRQQISQFIRGAGH
jgi:hypothetical protein